MEAIVAKNSKFFDSLVDLVPAKHYYDSDTEKINLKYEKKQARKDHKQAFKVKYKANKRQQLDPDTAITTLKLQQIKKAQDDEEHAEGAGHQSNRAVGALTGKALTPEERQALQDRLKAKIAEKQQQRESSKAHDAEAWLESRREHTKKKLEEARAGSKRKHMEEPAAGGKKHKPAQEQQQQQQQQQKQQQQGGQQQEGDGKLQLAFGRIEVDGQGAGDGKRREQKKSKVQLLKEAEAKRAQAQEASDDGKEVLRQDAWRNALARAQGEKVLDDPKLLRRSIKKEGKQREKSAKAWQERNAQQAQRQQMKQTKRKENLGGRRQAKLDTKKAKREKKLLRPGFEGRKDSFINKAK